MNLKNMSSERHQTQKITCCLIPYMGNPRKGKTATRESRSVIAAARG